jgi:PAS domain S-box-containing protein
MTKILIVDDEESIRNLLREFLSEVGYGVGVAEDASVAMKMLEEQDFEVVVADILLPKITGVDLLKSIRKELPHIQVLMMTGEPSVETAAEAVRAGAVDYLIKPIGKEQFMQTVERAVRVKALEDEGREHLRYQEHLEKQVDERTAALKASEMFLSRTETMGKIGGWEHDLVTDQLRWTNQIFHIFEIPWSSKPTKKLAVDFIHPEDRSKLEVVTQKAIESGEPYNIEYRTITAKGKHMWTHTRCNPVVVDGKTVKLSGILMDITERKQSEENLARANVELKQQIACLNESAIVSITDPEGNLTFVNDKFCITSGFSREELIGVNIRSLRSGYQEESFYKDIWDVLRKGEMWKGEVHLKKKDGTAQWLDSTIIPFRDMEGNIIKHVSVRFDITEKKELISALETAGQSTEDRTGL